VAGSLGLGGFSSYVDIVTWRYSSFSPTFPLRENFPKCIYLFVHCMPR
jgi:hypothetical protein